MSKFKANTSNVKWDQNNRSVTDEDDVNGPLTPDDEVAEKMAAGHPKSTPPSVKQGPVVMPGSPGGTSAPGANSSEPYPAPGSKGPPVSFTGSGGPLGST